MLKFTKRRLCVMVVCRLNYFLLLKKISVDDLSVALGISKTTLLKLRNCKAESISLKVLDSLCRFLCVTPGELFEYIPDSVDTEDGELELKCNLKYLIAKSGMTQGEFAKKVHYSTSTISALIKGHTDCVSFEFIDTVCRELNVVPGELFSYVKVKE